MDFTYRYASVAHRYLKKGRGENQKTSIWHDHHLPHSATHLLRIEFLMLLFVASRMLFFSGCVKFLDIAGNWNMLSYTLTPEQAMEELGNVQLPGIVFQILAAWSCALSC
jgi:hypothetical protein